MKNRWFMLAILYVSAVSVALGQLKIVPIMEQVAQVTGVSLTKAGLLVSVFTLTGIIFAIPGGAFLSKLGAKNLFLVLMGTLVLGNIIGAVSDLFMVLVVSRLIEGTAFAMIITVTLTMINTLFAEGGKGIATGIFTTFPAVGSFVTLNISLPLSNAFGIKTMWWLVAILGVFCFVLVLFFISVVEQPKAMALPKGIQNQKRTVRQIIVNPRLWIFSIFHFCIAFLLASYITTYPALFSGFYGLKAGAANFYSSFNGLSGIPFCILSGLIIEKTNKPYIVALVGSIGAALTAFFNLRLGTSYTFILHAMLTSLFLGGLALTANFCIGPRLSKNPENIGYTMVVINFFYYCGVFFCTPVILGIVETSGWKSATKVLITIAGTATGLMIALILTDSKIRRKI